MALMNVFKSLTKAVATAADFSNDDFKVMLTNTAPDVAVDDTYSDLSANEIDDTDNGYTAGGTAVVVTSFNDVAGLTSLIVVDVVFTQAGANAMGPFRYAVLYDSTTGDLLGYWDHGSAVTLAGGGSGETFTVDFSEAQTALDISIGS